MESLKNASLTVKLYGSVDDLNRSICLFGPFDKPAIGVIILISESIAIIVATFAKKRETGESIISMLIMMFMFLSGAYVPLEVLPATMKNIALALPYAWGVMGYRESLVLGKLVNWQHPVILWIWALALMVVAAVLFKMLM